MVLVSINLYNSDYSFLLLRKKERIHLLPTHHKHVKGKN